MVTQSNHKRRPRGTCLSALLPLLMFAGCEAPSRAPSDGALSYLSAPKDAGAGAAAEGAAAAVPQTVRDDEPTLPPPTAPLQAPGDPAPPPPDDSGPSDPSFDHAPTPPANTPPLVPDDGDQATSRPAAAPERAPADPEPPAPGPEQGWSRAAPPGEGGDEGEANPAILSPGWRWVTRKDLTPAQVKRYDAGLKAQQALAASLMGALTQAIAKDGAAAAVQVCNERAIPLTRDAWTQQLQLGRTSFKLRNPVNTPTTWMQPIISQQVKKPVIAVHTSGTVASMTPITTAPMCLQCHGAAGSLAPDVRAALAQRYPADQATGFESGDLRGWFWFESRPDGAEPDIDSEGP